MSMLQTQLIGNKTSKVVEKVEECGRISGWHPLVTWSRNHVKTTRCLGRIVIVGQRSQISQSHRLSQSIKGRSLIIRGLGQEKTRVSQRLGATWKYEQHLSNLGQTRWGRHSGKF